MLAEETKTAETFRSNATLIIHVQDKNDNTPEFADGFFQATVMENLPSETFVFQVGTTTGRLHIRIYFTSSHQDSGPCHRIPNYHKTN